MRYVQRDNVIRLSCMFYGVSSIFNNPEYFFILLHFPGSTDHISLDTKSGTPFSYDGVPPSSQLIVRDSQFLPLVVSYFMTVPYPQD